MADWYYFQGGNQQGPVSDDQLRGMVSSGQLSTGDSVWKQGMANWAPISSVPELMPQGGGGGGYGAPAPGPGPGPGPAPQEYQDYDRGYDRPARGPSGPSSISIWSIIMVAGGGLWLINSFLPWYSISIPEIGLSRTALGIHVGAGVFAMIISLFLLGAIITSWFVPILAEWRWTGAFFFALMGLILLILGIFCFHSPLSIGPFVHLLATLAVLAGSVLEGVFGLMAFLAKQKAGARNAPAQPQNY